MNWSQKKSNQKIVILFLYFQENVQTKNYF